MTTTALMFTAQAHPTGSLQLSWVVSLKLGSVTIREFTTSEAKVTYREGLESFIAEQIGDLFRENARAQYERNVADEQRMMYGDVS